VTALAFVLIAGGFLLVYAGITGANIVTDLRAVLSGKSVPKAAA
jgi:hypothetical protein